MPSRFLPTTLAILFTVGIVLTARPARADLVLTLWGGSSSTVFYEASGSVFVTSAHDAAISSVSNAPSATSTGWDGSYDENLGDILSAYSSTLNDDLVLSNGGISARKNGTEFTVYDTIDLDPSNTAGQDDVELDPSVLASHPVLAIGDEVSWVGSGFFTLETGTFNSIFTLGTYTNPIDGGNFVLEVTPEPSSAFLFALATIGLGTIRRRK